MVTIADDNQSLLSPLSLNSHIGPINPVRDACLTRLNLGITFYGSYYIRGKGDMNYQETVSYLFNSAPVFEHVGASAYKPGLQTTKALDDLDMDKVYDKLTQLQSVIQSIAQAEAAAAQAASSGSTAS